MSTLCFSPACFKHCYSHHLYHLSDGELSVFPLSNSDCSRFQAIYINIPSYGDLQCEEDDFFLVGVHIHEKGISIVGDFPGTLCPTTNTPPKTLLSAYQQFDPHLQDVCGTPSFFCDDDKQLIQSIRESNNIIFGASDAAYKTNQSTHAWAISSGNWERFRFRKSIASYIRVRTSPWSSTKPFL